MIKCSIKKKNLFLNCLFSKLMGLFIFTLLGYIGIYFMLISEETTSITGSFVSVPAEFSLISLIPLGFILLLIGMFVLYFCKKKN